MAENTSAVSANLTYLVQVIIAAVAARFSPNWLLGTVVLYHEPEPAYQPDPTAPPIPLPATVDVSPLMTYVRRPAAVGHILPGEIPLGGGLVSGPYPLAQRIPVAWPGVPSLTVTEPILPGAFGILHLSGKNHADAFVTGAPLTVPEYPPNPLRTSDAHFVPCILPGVVAASLPPGPAAKLGDMPQIGPLDARGATTFIRLLTAVAGWAIGGEQVLLGGMEAVLGVARMNDGSVPDASLITYMTFLETFLAGFGFAPPQPFAALYGNPAARLCRLADASTVTKSL